MQPFESGRVLPAKSLDFWFDYTCPYAYLGSTQARALAARMNVPLTYRPLLLGGVFRANDTPQKLFATLTKSKAVNNGEDMQRWAERFGVSLTMPANHPIRSVEALRATLVTKNDPRVIDAFYRAYWVDNADISDRQIVAKVVTSCGHDAERVLAEIDSPAIKDDLRARTEQAIALGIFGVPAWVVDSVHLYWGQDRIRFVEGHARAPDELVLAFPSPIDVYWDFSSPFAYLGASQVADESARWHPILLGGLFRSIGTPEVPIATFSEAKREYIKKDLERWAAYLGVPYRFPTRFPVMSLRALRVYIALPETKRAAYRAAVFRACWADDRDITDDAVLASCIGDENVAREALAKADSDDVKAELRRETDAASARGVYGVPTFIVGEDLYWGQDRLELARARARS